MSNNCTKCSTVQIIQSIKGSVLISLEVDELGNKFTIFCKQNNLKYKTEDTQTIWVKVDSFREFLCMLLETNFFNSLEHEAISLLFIAENEEFTASKVKQAKSLQKYKDILGAQDLSKLIENGALTTHFHPIVDLSTYAIYGYESLARGVNENGTLVYPDQLFKWAREGDMLFYLDRACRETSLKTAAVKNIKQKVFINFIPTSIYDPVHCLNSTVKWAKQLEFDPNNIVFEVVESDLITDLEHLKPILDFYKDQGYCVALDDIGSGYSSLNMLAKLKPDIIKVDREIMTHIDTNSINQSIFKAISQIANENNITVLAEGVERKEEIEFASLNGAHLVQGYYFGRPSAEPIRQIIV